MALTNEELAYRYDVMKAKLNEDIRNVRNAEAQWREHYIGLYRSHAEDNKKLINKYGLEGEADCWDIIERMQAALVNMQERNTNLRHQLDDYDQLNAAFENVRMERDALQAHIDTDCTRLALEQMRAERDTLDRALDEACADLERMDDRLADALADNARLVCELDDALDERCCGGCDGDDYEGCR